MFKTIKNIFSSIHPLIFMVSLCIGLFLTYSLTSAPEVIYVYPNPHNLQDTIYKDDSNKCFKYTSEKVNCSSNAFEMNTSENLEYE
jgi:hypothetical protein